LGSRLGFRSPPALQDGLSLKVAALLFDGRRFPRHWTLPVPFSGVGQNQLSQSCSSEHRIKNNLIRIWSTSGLVCQTMSVCSFKCCGTNQTVCSIVTGFWWALCMDGQPDAIAASG
jgi:hypothetical protein